MFIDNLALTESLLLFAAAILTYTGVSVWWAMRKNDDEKVRAALRGGALPAGAVGLTAVALGIWGEIVWPYPAVIGGYNILFNDMTLLFGVVLISLAAAAYLNARLQYVGIFAFVAGVVTLFYGWTAYGFHYTKEPFDTLLLYGAFGLSGILALPATIVADYYLGTVSRSGTAWRSGTGNPTRRGVLGTRAAQRVGLAPTSAPGAEPETGETTSVLYRMPIYVQGLVLAFPVIMALAGIAAGYYLGVTIPGHLTPGATP
ncbi:MAG TPA: DUF981 family protein [Thermoplasmata archaeon]|nr:DUF981 family protein [Thermoplasmata archaeon]